MSIAILVVCSDRQFRTQLVQRLNQKGYITQETQDAAELEERLKAKEQDLVILDSTDFRDQEFLNTIERVKKIQPKAQIIALVSPKRMNLSISGMQLGVFEDVFFPIDWDSLLKKLEAGYRYKLQCEKKDKSFWNRLESHLTAISFAEADAEQIAREILKNKKSNK